MVPKKIKEKLKLSSKIPLKSQLEFSLERPQEKDRNFHKGGRSFYFFDFDDNIAMLPTVTYIFHKKTGKEVALSSGAFARFGKSIGVRGEFKDYSVNFNDSKGTFRNFRDKDFSTIERLLKKKQSFIHDLETILKRPDYEWKGPSWSCFYHAVYNQRPLSLITARGHDPETIKEGIKLLHKKGHLPSEPNYLSIFPVSNPKVQKHFSGDAELDVATLKGRAIQASFYRALEVYGDNPHHRFGMSDDDPKNIELITNEMNRLKARYPEMSFYVIETHEGKFIKKEIFSPESPFLKAKPKTRKPKPKSKAQLDFFS